MKRSSVVGLLMLCSLVAFGQNKGDKYVAASFGASFGSQTYQSYDGTYTTSQNSPLTTTLCVQGEFGYFIADNIRFALAIGVPFSSTPRELSGNSWLMSKTISFQINPNIAYYFRLTDSLYYTPEVGFTYEFGSVKEDMTASATYSLDYSGWDIYANLLALEFRVNSKFAIGVGFGSIGYSDGKITDKGSANYFSTSQFRCNLNSGSVHFRFYL